MKRPPIKVVFRTYDDGETVALLFEYKDEEGQTKGFSHNSRWFFTEYQRIMRMTRTAVRKEYMALFDELKGEGFKRIQIYQRARIKTSYIAKTDQT